MKRDLKINFGVLDDIIGELQKYDNALQTMEGSLEVISALVKTNEGESIKTWDHHIRTSKDEIGRYQKQMNDLLSLFENYVTDTTALISPLERNTMMRYWEGYRIIRTFYCAYFKNHFYSWVRMEASS